MKLWRETPLIESTKLSEAAGCRILLKLENLQPSGSFKSRGIGNYCQQALLRAASPSAVHYYCASGGNAGLACVYAARSLGKSSTVVVPTTTKPMMIDRIKAAGASEVVQIGKHIAEADQYLKCILLPAAKLKGQEPVYIHPFDHEDIFAGHRTIVDEIRTQLSWSDDGAPDAIVCAVGGGGLFTGIHRGIQAQGESWERTQLIGAQTQGANALSASLENGQIVTLPGITSLATSLGCTKCAQKAFDIAKQGQASGRVKTVVFSDAEAAMGCWQLADNERILVELACGVCTAVCYGGRLEKVVGRPLSKKEKVVIVLCGGSNINASMIEEYREQFGI
ncbi:tryptophan synthase beta subunit-like PLP-dependent enzyme [Polychaeton citri CBS 116435]|uniref:L-serine ammonia-lyase n=1 Tax=Polychaeton citri CBS 116435 TaxID=1314669 RepID=A0A9P4Q1K9_9PEZI|nr:tryptophan synthase beta subunit-like PLP-dependent enzyme [Polychaeton citri CBS 116435]